MIGWVKVENLKFIERNVDNIKRKREGERERERERDEMYQDKEKSFGKVSLEHV